MFETLVSGWVSYRVRRSGSAPTFARCASRNGLWVSHDVSSSVPGLMLRFG